MTYSLNMILRGFLKAGDHVITTAMEHNAVLRTLHDLGASGVRHDIAKCDRKANLDLADLARLINGNTKAVIMTHASNVCGGIMPIYDVAEICKKRGIKLIVDSAQTAGVLDIDMEYIDALAFTAHKGLLAAQGLGGFIIKSDMAAQTKPIITGGTGSASHEIEQPEIMPDKFESGTMNLPAIMGLKKSLEYIASVGTKTIYKKEMILAGRFIEQISRIDGVEIIGKRDAVGRIAVVSLDFKAMDNAEVAAILDAEYGVMTRCGLHCSPNAHKALGTYPEGTVRFSFGHFNTAEEIDYIVESVEAIVR
jgi:cysteine desulfurase family protein